MGSPIQAEATRAELVRIENEIVRANQQCEYDHFCRIEAPEFIFTDGNGGVSTRADDLARRSRFTDVFVRRLGEWQLVSGQSTRIPAAP